jgi:NTP pyrophosphatase (non-canonical NTP hydrolase)
MPDGKQAAIFDLLKVMARLRSPRGCPWDQEQDHFSLRFHAVEEVYELLDAIEAGDDLEMMEELGDLLMQVVFHCQLARERKVFDFDRVCRHLVEKLVRRHPHVFGTTKVTTAAGVKVQWDQIKHAEKKGTHQERPSALDGIPRHLPALLRAEKLVKKARKAGLLAPGPRSTVSRPRTPSALARELFALVEFAQGKGWSPEDLLRLQIKRRERSLRRLEKKGPPTAGKTQKRRLAKGI